jgi:rubrerythrin
MTEQENAVDLDVAAFREVVRHPRAHAHILQQYRVGEYAGVVALKRLLGEMQPEGKLHTAMEIHYRDEDRHSRVFTDWIYRLGVEPEPLPSEVEGYFANSREEFLAQRQLVEQLPPDLRRIIVFAGINAIEKIAFNQFETHLRALDRADDVELLQSVMNEEKFHLSYVEGELDRQINGENGGFIKMALDTAKARFAEFSDSRRKQSRDAIEKLMGGGA